MWPRGRLNVPKSHSELALISECTSSRVITGPYTSRSPKSAPYGTKSVARRSWMAAASCGIVFGVAAIGPPPSNCSVAESQHCACATARSLA